MRVVDPIVGAQPNCSRVSSTSGDRTARLPALFGNGMDWLSTDDAIGLMRPAGITLPGNGGRSADPGSPRRRKNHPSAAPASAPRGCRSCLAGC